MQKLGITAIILAAGKGRRMGGKIPKPLLELAGKPILEWAIDSLNKVGVEDIRIVTGHKNELIKDFVKNKKIGKIYKQKQLNGTAKAVEVALNKPLFTTVLVLFGDDSGLYTPKTLIEFIQFHLNSEAKMTMMTTESTISSIGGLEIGNDGFVLSVLTEDQLKKREAKTATVACGAFCFNIRWLKDNLSKIKPSTISEEYPLPGLISIANRQNVKVFNFSLKNLSEWNSVNTPQEFEKARYKKRLLLKEYA